MDGKQETIEVDSAWRVLDETKLQLILESSAIKNNAQMIRISAGWRNGCGEVLANEAVELLNPV